MTPIKRRATPAQVARSLREAAILWKPPDENETAPGGTEAVDTAEHLSDADYTLPNPEAVNTDLLAIIGRRIWTVSYSLEERRQRYAATGKSLRQACTCLALALLRLAVVRHV